jgi:hypothetical protein
MNRKTSAEEALRLGTRFVIATRRGHLAIRSGEALGARLGLRLADLTIDVADVSLELANALSDRRPDLRHPPRPEEHEHDDEENQHLAKAKVSETHIFS